MGECNTCALQFKEACPYKFGAPAECSSYVRKETVTPKPPRRGGRSVADPGEYRREPAPPAPMIREPQKKKMNNTTRPQTSGGQKKRQAPLLQKGQKLFYRNKKTGIIEYGVVTACDRYGFEFTFDRGQRRTSLSNSALGTRLFFSHKAAWQNYLKTKEREK